MGGTFDRLDPVEKLRTIARIDQIMIECVGRPRDAAERMIALFPGDTPWALGVVRAVRRSLR